MEEVRDLVREHLPQPLYVARPDFRRLVDVHPDVRHAIPEAVGEAVRDFVLVREVDPQAFVERHVQVFGERGIRLLSDGSGIDLDAFEAGRGR